MANIFVDTHNQY